MSIPNLYANTPLMVSSFAILLFWRSLTVHCSIGYNSGSNWNFQKILSDSERCISLFYYHSYGNLLFGAIAARGSEGVTKNAKWYSL